MHASMSTLRYGKFGLICRTQQQKFSVEVPFGVVGQVDRRRIFPVRVGSPSEKSNFWEIGQRNVTYRKHVALRCRCNVLAAE